MDYQKERINSPEYKWIPEDQKVLSALRKLSFGTSSDSLNDTNYVSKNSVRLLFQHLYVERIETYGVGCFNRFPTLSEPQQIKGEFSEIVFSGCKGPVNSMRYKWKCRPTTMKVPYVNSRDSKTATLKCQDWCDHNIYCCSWYSGRPRTNIDINVLTRSARFQSIFSERFCTTVTDVYEIASVSISHHLLYILANGIMEFNRIRFFSKVRFRIPWIQQSLNFLSNKNPIERRKKPFFGIL